MIYYSSCLKSLPPNFHHHYEFLMERGQRVYAGSGDFPVTYPPRLGKVPGIEMEPSITCYCAPSQMNDGSSLVDREITARQRLSPISAVLVPGKKYPQIEGIYLYERSDPHGCFAIYFFNPCLRVLLAWDKYHRCQDKYIRLDRDTREGRIIRNPSTAGGEK